MFEAAGWQTITVKYGRRLRELFARHGRRGAAPPDRRDDQRGVPAPAASHRRRAARAAARRRRRPARDRAADRGLDDDELRRRDRATSAATTWPPCSTPSGRPTRSRDRPTVIFAYTIKALAACRRRATRPTTRRCSPTSSGAARRRAGRRRRRPVGGVRPDGTRRGRAVRRMRPSGCARPDLPRAAAARRAPRDRPHAHAASASTQQAFGRFFVDLARAAPDVAARVVTVSPDVASSTNLGGWINQAGRLEHGRAHRLVRRRPADRWCAGASPPTASTSSSASPRATWSALLGELGRDLVARRASRCFRSARSTTRSSTARSSRGRSASTPAASRSSSARRRASRSPRRAAPTSRSSRPSVGLEQPRCVAWEPAFGQDLEWTLLARAEPARAPGRQPAVLPAEHAAARPGPGRACPAIPGRASSGAGTCSPAAIVLRDARPARPTSRWSEWARSCRSAWRRPTS